MYREIPIALAILASVVALGSGCAPRVDSQPGAGQAVAEAVSTPDLEVPVSTNDGFPDYVYRSAFALRGYQIAVSEGELLSRLPCYCGCGQDPEYTNLLDCFIDPDGGFRSHGANCQVCLEEAEDAATWKAEGMSTKQLRDRIDATYEGRGPPTDTPPVLD